MTELQLRLSRVLRLDIIIYFVEVNSIYILILLTHKGSEVTSAP